MTYKQIDWHFCRITVCSKVFPISPNAIHLMNFDIRIILSTYNLDSLLFHYHRIHDGLKEFLYYIGLKWYDNMKVILLMITSIFQIFYLYLGMYYHKHVCIYNLYICSIFIYCAGDTISDRVLIPKYLNTSIHCLSWGEVVVDWV